MPLRKGKTEALLLRSCCLVAGTAIAKPLFRRCFFFNKKTFVYFLECCCCIILVFSLFLQAAAAAAVFFPSSCSRSFHVFSVLCFFCQPVLSFVSLNFSSLYSLNSVICAPHLQHENLSGCTPSHLDLCFVCAPLQHWRPLVLSALDASVPVSALAMWPAHQCSSCFLSMFGSMSCLFIITSFSVSCFPPFCLSCFFWFSQSCSVRTHF